MKKPILKGPKLIAVGPLKCFKGNGGGSSSGNSSSSSGGKGGGSSSSSSSGSKGGAPSAQKRESDLAVKQLKKEEEAAEKKRVKEETSMGGQLAGMDFSDIKRDPVTGKQTGQVKKRDDRSTGEKVGGFFKGLAGGTFSTDADEQQAAFDKAEAANLSKRAGRNVSVEEMKEFEEQGGGFGGPSAREYFGQKDKAKAEGVTDFAFTDQAEVARLEAEEKAAADIQKARELEDKRVKEEVSPFTKQLAGVDIDKATQAQEDRREKRRFGEETSGFGRRLEKEMNLGQEIQKQSDLREAGFDADIVGRPAEEMMAIQQERDDLKKEQSAFTKQLAGVDIDKAIEAQEQRRVDEETNPFGRQLEKEGLDFQKAIADRELSQDLKKQEEIRKKAAIKIKAENEALEKEQSSFGRQLEDEGFDFQKAIADRELSQDLERQDEIRRKDARERALLEKEASPFSKQLEGVDIEAAEAAEFDRYKAKAKAERAERKRLEADPRFGSQEEFEAFKDQQKKEADQAEDVERYSEWEKSVRDRQAEMDRKKGAIDKETFEEFTGKEDVGPGVKTKIVDGVKTKVIETAEGTLLDTAGNLIKNVSGLGLVNTLSKAVGGPDIVKTILDKTGISGAVKSGVRGAVDKATPDEEPTPTTFEEALESMQTEEVTKPAPKPKKGGDAGKALAALGAGALAAKALQPKAKEPAEPAPAAEPAKGEPTDVKGEQQQLLEDLKKQASGEESLAEKQVRRTQDRSLAQRLAALKSMRGQDAGTKLRSFSKASDRARREAEGQIEIAGMKERRSAQDQLRAQLNTMSQAEATERWNKINRDDKQRLLRMEREDAIKKGEYTKWLTVAALGQKFFPKQIKGVGDWVGTNVLDPAIEGGKKILSGAVDFIGDVFSAEGGYISGPGTETSDSIPARLSDGEFVVKASAVRGLGKELGAKGKGDEREKGVDFLYKLQDKMDKAEKFAKGGEAYVRPKKAFREAIGYEPESRFHDKAEKDAKFGGARRKFRHFQQGGAVSLGVKGLKPQFNVPQSQGYGSVIAAQKDLDRRLADLERQLGR